jgi:hypothetical protein
MARKQHKGEHEGLNPDAYFFKLCVAPVDEEEFLFYSKSAMSAGQLEAPLKKGAENYVGLYMYTGTNDGKDLFKNIITREYLK